MVFYKQGRYKQKERYEKGQRRHLSNENRVAASPLSAKIGRKKEAQEALNSCSGNAAIWETSGAQELTWILEDGAIGCGKSPKFGKMQSSHVTIVRLCMAIVVCAPLVIAPRFPSILNVVLDLLGYFEMVKY